MTTQQQRMEQASATLTWHDEQIRDLQARVTRLENIMSAIDKAVPDAKRPRATQARKPAAKRGK